MIAEPARRRRELWSLYTSETSTSLIKEKFRSCQQTRGDTIPGLLIWGACPSREYDWANEKVSAGINRKPAP